MRYVIYYVAKQAQDYNLVFTNSSMNHDKITKTIVNVTEYNLEYFFLDNTAFLFLV